MKKTTRKEVREKENKIFCFAEFIKIKEHFFKNINKRLKSVKDTRHQSYIQYEPDILLFPVILKNICYLDSMTSMTEKFNKKNVLKVLQNL